ncbi:hypothetical protein [Brevibacterium album]|uniref:hypothetical protein n=1 Tax=Brevibacterium album TaxID=417948 RepID=UPI0004115E63|nr:hypothetical protein [Brevibacterium album]
MFPHSAALLTSHGREGFGPLFRLGNRLQYLLLWVFGPARLSHAQDPREQLTREYRRRKELARGAADGHGA